MHYDLDELETRARRTGRANEPLLVVIAALRDALSRIEALEEAATNQGKAQAQLDAILQVDIPSRSVL